MESIDGGLDRLHQGADLSGLVVEELWRWRTLLAQRWKWKGEIDGMTDIELFLCGTVLNQINLIPSRSVN